MVVYNAVTLTATGQLLRWGSTDFENDGTFDSGTETFHSDIGKKLLDVVLKYSKIVGGVVVEMTQAEKDAVDAIPEDPLTDFHNLKYPTGELETLSADGAISLTSYTTTIDASSLTLTLADGLVKSHGKRIQTQTGSCLVTCSLKPPNVSFNLGNNNKAELMWHEHPSGNFWLVIDSKGITFNL